MVAFEKTNQGRRGLTREMQFARTLDRRRAIFDESFELIKCWEHDFKERPLYPKKKKGNFSSCHSVRYRGVAGHEQTESDNLTFLHGAENRYFERCGTSARSLNEISPSWYA